MDQIGRAGFGIGREAPVVTRAMALIVALVVLVAFVWFFFLGGAIDDQPRTVSGFDTTHQNQVQQQVRDDPPANAP